MIEDLLKQPNCNFVLYIGNKKSVKRKDFEVYISQNWALIKAFHYLKVKDDVV